MSMYSEILAHKLCEERLAEIIDVLLPEPEKTAELICYEALCKIKAIIEDDSLSDGECFRQIEELVGVFESIGSGGGTRHDFG